MAGEEVSTRVQGKQAEAVCRFGGVKFEEKSAMFERLDAPDYGFLGGILISAGVIGIRELL